MRRWTICRSCYLSSLQWPTDGPTADCKLLSRPSCCKSGLAACQLDRVRNARPPRHRRVVTLPCTRPEDGRAALSARAESRKSQKLIIRYHTYNNITIIFHTVIQTVMHRTHIIICYIYILPGTTKYILYMNDANMCEYIYTIGILICVSFRCSLLPAS